MNSARLPPVHLLLHLFALSRFFAFNSTWIVQQMGLARPSMASLAPPPSEGAFSYGRTANLAASQVFPSRPALGRSRYSETGSISSVASSVYAPQPYTAPPGLSASTIATSLRRPAGKPRSARIDFEPPLPAEAHWLLLTTPPPPPRARSGSLLSVDHTITTFPSRDSQEDYIPKKSWGKKGLAALGLRGQQLAPSLKKGSVASLRAPANAAGSQGKRAPPSQVQLQLGGGGIAPPRPSTSSRRGGRLDSRSDDFEIPRTWEDYAARYGQVSRWVFKCSVITTNSSGSTGRDQHRRPSLPSHSLELGADGSALPLPRRFIRGAPFAAGAHSPKTSPPTRPARQGRQLSFHADFACLRSDGTWQLRLVTLDGYLSAGFHLHQQQGFRHLYRSFLRCIPRRRLSLLGQSQPTALLLPSSCSVTAEPSRSPRHPRQESQALRHQDDYDYHPRGAATVLPRQRRHARQGRQLAEERNALLAYGVEW